MSSFTKFIGSDDKNNAAGAQRDALNKTNDLYEKNKQTEAEVQPYYSQWLKASTNPLGDVSSGMTDWETEAKAHGIDPYSSSNTELESGAYRDDTAQGVQRAIAAINNANPMGALGSSAQGSAINQVYANAAQDNAAQARNLRIRGAQERYSNYVARRNELISQRYKNYDALGNAGSQLMNVRGAMNGNIGGIQTSAQNLNQIGNEKLTDAVQLATTAGGLYAKTRNTGSNSSGTNQNGNTSWAGPTPVQRYGNYSTDGTNMQSRNPDLFGQ